MANNKFLQLFRSSNVYNSKSEAISALKTAFGEHKKDGEPIIARYYTSPDKVAVKTLLGVSYFSGSEGAVVHDTIIDVDAMPSEVQKAIESLIGGASTGYDTLKKIEDAVKTEVERAKAAEKANADAIAIINGNESTDGSIAKALKDAKTYADTQVSAEQTRAQGQETAIRSEFAAADSSLKTELLGDAGDNYNTLGKLEDEIQKVASDAKTYEIVAVTENLGTNVKEAWKLVDEDGKQAGATINIYKDSTLKEVKLVDQVLQFTYILADGTEQTVGIDVSKFLAETEFKNGLAVSEGKVSVKIDENSESFLTVGENGVKISGVQKAINSAETAANQHANDLNTAMNTRVNALETAIGEGGSVVTQINNAIANLDVEAVGGKGQLITTVSETDGKISATAIDATAANIAVADTDNKFTATNVEGVLAEIDTAYKAADAQVRTDFAAADSSLKTELLGAVSDTDAKTIAALNDKIETAQSDATAAIKALDVPDAAVSTQYVSAVSETDGKISVTRANLVAAEANGNSNDMLSTDSNGSIVLSNVFDMGTY